MLHIALVCAGLLAGQTIDTRPSPPELREYEALRAAAGRQPGAHS